MSTVTLQDAEDAIRRAGRELDRARQAGDDAARRGAAETAPGALMSQLNDWYVGWADGARRRFRRQLTDEQVAANDGCPLQLRLGARALRRGNRDGDRLQVGHRRVRQALRRS